MRFQPGQQVFTCTTVNLRAAPGYQGPAAPPVLASPGPGSACTVTGAPVAGDELTWWPVETTLADGRLLRGWIAEAVGDQLLLDAHAPAPPPPPTPAPEPALPAETLPGNRLGFYIHSADNGAGLWDAIARVQPPVLLLHDDAANDILLSEIRAFRAPATFVVGRHYLTNDEQRALLESGDPAEAGRTFAERILTYDFDKFRRRTPAGRLFIDGWMSLNECLPGPASSSYREDPARYHRLYDAYDRFQEAFHARLAQDGIEAVAFNFAAGNFTEAAHYLDFFPRTLQAYTWLGFHEYGWPSLIPDGGASAAGIYRRVLEGIRARYGPRHRVIITEAGLTRAYGHPQNPDEGWLNGAEPLGEEEYWRSLDWYNRHLSADGYVLGACLYQVGHRGDWATFRHLGQDNQGRDLRLVDRLVALKEQEGSRAGVTTGPSQPPPIPSRQRFALSGLVTAGGEPARRVEIRLLGGDETLGGVRGAVIDRPGAWSWSRRVRGFAGSLRVAWDRMVAGRVAGITYDEFKRMMPLMNPSLASAGRSRSAGRLRSAESYLLPESSAHSPIVWDRRLVGYGGTLRSAWLDFVQGKVIGLSYESFRRLVTIHNPHLAHTTESSRGRGISRDSRLDPNQSYLLPRTAGSDRYRLTTQIGGRGRFSFGDLPPGRYQIVVDTPGYKRFAADVDLAADLDVEIELEPLIDDLSARGPGSGPFVGGVGSEFVVNGQILRFVGVNLRGLVYYGSGLTGMLQPTVEQHRHETLAAAADMGARVVRVFLPCVNASAAQTIDLFARTLDAAGSRGLYVIPAFVDFYKSTDFRIPGDDHFYAHADPNFPIELLTGSFYRGGYAERYLPFVEAVVRAFRDDTRIFAWEVGNELKYEPAFDDPNRAAFIGFMHATARAIKRIDPNHLVTTGMISTSHASLNDGDLWRSLYGGSEFDFLTVHCYNEEYAGKQDYDFARALNKPFIVEEAGFGAALPGDRVALTRRDMDRWFGLGARGYMQWGYMPVGGDIGDGDRDSGMDRAFHGHDFDGLTQLYRERAAALAAQAAALPRPTPPVVTPPPPPPEALAPFSPGQTVYAQTTLRLRQTPGFVGKPDSDTIAMLPPGQVATVEGASTSADGLAWWPLRATLPGAAPVAGWAAAANADATLLAPAPPAAIPRGELPPPQG